MQMEHSGVVHMLKTRKVEDLSCMYKLFSRVEGGLACMVKCMSGHLRETGRGMVMEEGGSGDAPGRNAGAFVQALLDLRDIYNRFLVESFCSDQQFKNAIASVS
jgi:cullin 3